MTLSFSVLVGVAFFITSLMKMFYSHIFIHHIDRLRIFPARLGPLLAILFIEFEAGLGVGLILGIYSHLLIPFAFVLIVGMSFGISWGILSGRVDDCGCYGSFLSLSLPQTLLLNSIYCILLGVDYYYQHGSSYTPEWKLYLTVGVVLGVHFLAKRSVFTPLFDLSGIKVGKRWNNSRMSSELVADNPTEGVFFFLDDHCSQCQDWRDRLSVVNPEAVQQRIYLLLSGEESATGKFAESIPFPVHRAEGFRISLLQGQLPMAVLVEDGVIVKIWKRSFPSFMS